MVQLATCRSCNMAFKDVDMCVNHEIACKDFINDSKRVESGKCRCFECLERLKNKTSPCVVQVSM